MPTERIHPDTGKPWGSIYGMTMWKLETHHYESSSPSERHLEDLESQVEKHKQTIASICQLLVDREIVNESKLFHDILP